MGILSVCKMKTTFQFAKSPDIHIHPCCSHRHPASGPKQNQKLRNIALSFISKKPKKAHETERPQSFFPWLGPPAEERRPRCPSAFSASSYYHQSLYHGGKQVERELGSLSLSILFVAT